ncbi:VOC family protein [Polycladomyces subterraneus]|uniref:VOC family protein n=1 Tax=Polycladomyces subterraneus TaxID=1016997 RepID=UPI003419AE4C
MIYIIPIGIQDHDDEWKKRTILLWRWGNISSLFQRVDTVFCYVQDLEQAKRWYQDVFGFSIRFENDDICSLNISETPLTLIQSPPGEPFQPARRAFFNFYVSDTEMARNHLLKHNVIVSEIFDDKDVKWMWFQDLDGNRIEICCFS